MDSYLLIVIPPAKVLSLVDKYRKKYTKYTSYIIPPHITIYPPPPFFIKNSDEKEIIESLKAEFSGTTSKAVSLESINYAHVKGKNGMLKNPANFFLKHGRLVISKEIKAK